MGQTNMYEVVYLTVDGEEAVDFGPFGWEEAVAYVTKGGHCHGVVIRKLSMTTHKEREKFDDPKV